MGAPRPLPPPWWELRLAVPAHLSEDLAALMVDDGAMGVQTLDAQAPEPSQAAGAHPSLGPQRERTRPATVAESAESWAAQQSMGRTEDGAASQATLVASYTDAYTEAEVLALAESALAQLGATMAPTDAHLRRRQDDDWAHAWRQHFKPQKIGRRLWVVPSWETSFCPPTGSVSLRVDPGMAFGTGQHATTAMCLRAVESHLDALAPRARQALRVLDVGCGSGILTMAALALGAERATAVDIDPLAVAATEENLGRMGLTARCTTGLTPIEQVNGVFDLVLANILAPALTAMAPALAARVAPGGTLVLSGLLVAQADAVGAALLAGSRRPGVPRLQLARRLQHEGWAALLLEAAPS